MHVSVQIFRVTFKFGNTYEDNCNGFIIKFEHICYKSGQTENEYSSTWSIS